MLLAAKRMPRLVERAFHRLAPDGAAARQADAERREHTRQRVQQDFVDSKRGGHRTRVLPGRAAETQQRMLGRIGASMQCQFADRICHPRHGDIQIRVGEGFDAVLDARLCQRDTRQSLQALSRRVAVDRIIPARAEDLRECPRWDPAQHDVAIGDRGRPTAPVTRRAGISARRFRPDLEAAVRKFQDRSAARCNRLDVHQRRLQSHTIDLRGEAPRDLAGRETHVGGRTAHVKTNQPARAIRGTRGDHAHDATGRSRDHAVDTAKAGGVDEPAIALHERDGRCPELRLQRRHEFPRVLQQHGRQVCVHDGRFAACNESQQRRSFVRCDDFREAAGPRAGRGEAFVLRVTEAVQEHDRNGLDARCAR
jgi:hypothetical protein